MTIKITFLVSPYFWLCDGSVGDIFDKYLALIWFWMYGNYRIFNFKSNHVFNF